MSTRKPIMAGNWKMNLTVAEGLALATEVRDLCSRARDVEVVLGPPATALHPIGKRLEGSNIKLAAQNCHEKPSGAFTGELSPPQLAEVGCTYVIVGHSERRQIFGETDAGVAAKARALHDHGVLPIVCVGETLEQRDGGETLSVVLGQVQAGLAELNAGEVASTVLAYEPVWAIGTGRTATPSQAQEVHAAIRGRLVELYGADVASRVRIQYGGSVKPDNVDDLMAQEDIDGALVGGASLKAESFKRIVFFERSER